MFKPFKPERILTAGELEAYSRYVEWRAERAGPLAEEHYRRHLAWLEACRVEESTRRATAAARAASERAREAEAAFVAEQRRRKDAACELEKRRRAEKIAARMKALGFRHPYARASR